MIIVISDQSDDYFLHFLMSEQNIVEICHQPTSSHGLLCPNITPKPKLVQYTIT